MRPEGEAGVRLLGKLGHSKETMCGGGVPVKPQACPNKTYAEKCAENTKKLPPQTAP